MTLIEQVARALAVEVWGDNARREQCIAWEGYASDAKTAIIATLKAIRNPMNKMAKAGYYIAGNDGVLEADAIELASDIAAAMIDTLISEVEG